MKNETIYFNTDENDDNEDEIKPKTKEISLQEIDEYISKSESISNDLKPIFDMKQINSYELPERVSDKIKSKRQEITDLKSNKEKTITKIIGQMYNGVLLSKSLSFRKGEIFEYRCQYHPSIKGIKEKIMTHIHEIDKKLSPENMDILEFCLDKIDDNDDSHSYSYGSGYNDNEDKSKDFDFDEIKLIQIEDDERCEKELKVMIVNGVSVTDKGYIKFFYKYKIDKKDENGEKIKGEKVDEKDVPNLNDSSESVLYLKFENEIKEMSKEFIIELDNEIENRENEMKEIKEKGSSQLMICEISKDSDKVNGYGGN